MKRTFLPSHNISGLEGKRKCSKLKKTFYSSQYNLNKEIEVNLLEIDLQKVEREHIFQVFGQIVIFFLFIMNRKIKPIYECRCNGRLQTKKFTILTYTGLVVELEHLQIETRLINEKFTKVMGEYVTDLEVIDVPSRL